jgi:hypothetical protein
VVEGVGELLGERLVQGDDLQAQPLGGVRGGGLAEVDLVRQGGASSSIVGWVESPAS